jgi:hypothetical protein
VLAAATAATRAAVAAAGRRFEAAGAVWRVANRIIGGQLLTTNTDPPWAAA